MREEGRVGGRGEGGTSNHAHLVIINQRQYHKSATCSYMMVDFLESIVGESSQRGGTAAPQANGVVNAL